MACDTAGITTGESGTLTGTELTCTDAQATCAGAGQVAAPGACDCVAGNFGRPVFDGVAWNNPCATTAVGLVSSLRFDGTTAAALNTPESKAALALVLEDAIRAQNGRDVVVTNVEAVDVSGGGRRALLAGQVDVSFTVHVPFAEGTNEQSVFDAVVADLSTAAAAGGAIAVGATASLGGLQLDSDAFVAPTTFVPLDSADTWCVGIGSFASQYESNSRST